MNTFICPECGRTSYNPTNFTQGWCNYCKGEGGGQYLEPEAIATPLVRSGSLDVNSPGKESI